MGVNLRKDVQGGQGRFIPNGPGSEDLTKVINAGIELAAERNHDVKILFEGKVVTIVPGQSLNEMQINW